MNVNKLPINSAPLPLPKGVDKFKRYVDKNDTISNSGYVPLFHDEYRASIRLIL